MRLWAAADNVAVRRQLKEFAPPGRRALTTHGCGVRGRGAGDRGSMRAHDSIEPFPKET